jgi:hypothetical protein
MVDVRLYDNQRFQYNVQLSIMLGGWFWCLIREPTQRAQDWYAVVYCMYIPHGLLVESYKIKYSKMNYCYWYCLEGYHLYHLGIR